MAIRGGDRTREFQLDVSFGIIPGYRTVTLLGHNPDIDTGTVPEDVWSGGGLYPFMDAAGSLEIVSASADDAAAGTGARTVTIDFLDANYVESSVTVTLNGTTAVAISGTWFRINGATVITAGSGRVNAGDITIRDAGAGATRSIMPAGAGILKQSIFTVPAAHTLCLTALVHSINRPTSVRDATITAFIRTVTSTVLLTADISVDGNPVFLPLNTPFIVPEKTSFGFRCVYVSASNTDLTSAWAGILKENARD